MEASRAVLIALAGMGAGTINTVVGSGTLVTFPTLLALGYPPVTANVSNNIGLVFGGISGTWGYRRELSGQRDLARRLAPMSVGGAVVGALLLLQLPESAFEAVVPILITLSVALVVVQPWLARRVAAGHPHTATTGPLRRAAMRVATGLAGVYGGYFGAAQGVLLIGLLGSLLPEPLQRLNALKNLLVTLVNTVAAVTFLVVSPAAAEPAVVVLVALGAFVGGVIGARVGRWLPAPVLRTVIVVIGVVAVVRLVAP